MELLRRHLFASFAALILAGSITGVAPLGAQLLSGQDSIDDCCPDDGDDEELPCSPFCGDCACGLGGRYVQRTEPSSRVEAPPVAVLPVVAPLADELDAPTTSFVDEILRPPRA